MDTSIEKTEQTIPDEDTFESFNDEWQAKCLALLLRSKDFWNNHSSYVKAEYFTGQHFREIYVIAKELYQFETNGIDKDVLRDRVSKHYTDNNIKNVPLDSYFTVIAALYEFDVADLERAEPYTSDKVIDFAQRQAMKAKIIEAALLVDTGKPMDGIPERLMEALIIGAESENEPQGLFEILSEQEEEPDWLIDRFLMAGDTGFLTADPKTGKTILSEQVALCLAFGPTVNFIGMDIPKPRKVFYLRFELNDYRFKQHIKALLRGLMKDGRKEVVKEPFFILKKPFDLLSQKDFDWLMRELDKIEPDLLITDPLFKMIHLDLKSDNLDPYFKRKDQIMTRNPDLCWLIDHHRVKQWGQKGKEDGSWGTSYGGQRLFADMDFEIRLRASGVVVKGEPAYFNMDYRSNDVPVDGLYLRRDPDTLLYTAEVQSSGSEKSEELRKEIDQSLSILRRLIREHIKVRQADFKSEIALKLKVSLATAYRIIQRGIEDGSWFEYLHKGKPHYDIQNGAEDDPENSVENE